MSYYLISTEYVGPNDRDSRGHPMGDTRALWIDAVCGETNLSHERRTSGWLGTTSDNCVYALGEYDTIEDAREEAHRRGYTVAYDDTDEYGRRDPGSTAVEAWITPRAGRTQVDAGEWFDGGPPQGVHAHTADDELDQIAESEYELAVEDGYEVHGLLEYLTERRDELRDEEWGDADTSERLALCARYQVSRFAARHDTRPWFGHRRDW